MPFTLAHPIAAAPIWLCSKRRLDLPSLLVGSMIPDLEYFLALQPTRTIGHTLIGILIQGLPCSIVLLLVTRYVLMRPFLALLPQQLAQRFPTLRSYFPLQVLHLFNVVVSVVIGAASHLVWDAFTHEGGWFVNHSKLLQSQLGPLPIYKLLQYGSGVIGILALLLWLSIWLNQAKSRNRIETLAPRWRGLTIICIALCAFVFAWVAVEINRIAGEPFSQAVVRAVIGCISGLFLGLLLYSAVFWMLNSFKPHTTAS
ncbi:MAG TPA: DUF4184 family protein [Coleofasciculaceae cyanobacterium]